MSTRMFPRDSLWDEYGPDNLKPFPVCTIRGDSVNKGNVTRVFGDSLIYGPFHSGYHDGLLVPRTLIKMFDCNVNYACLDQVNPQAMKGAIWSWAEGEPSAVGCTYMRSDGRWGVKDCKAQLPFLCVNHQNEYVVNPKRGPWNAAACPKGYSFAVPVNGNFNLLIASAVRGTELWLNHKP